MKGSPDIEGFVRKVPNKMTAKKTKQARKALP